MQVETEEPTLFAVVFEDSYVTRRITTERCNVELESEDSLRFQWKRYTRKNTT